MKNDDRSTDYKALFEVQKLLADAAIKREKEWARRYYLLADNIRAYEYYNWAHCRAEDGATGWYDEAKELIERPE